MEDGHHRKRLWAEVAGWYGTFAIVLAYVLVSFGILPARGGGAYQLLNLSGAVGIIVISAAKGVRQPLFLNVFWAIIALVGLIKAFVG